MLIEFVGQKKKSSPALEMEDMLTAKLGYSAMISEIEH